MTSTVERIYAVPGLEEGQVERILLKARTLGLDILSIKTGFCYNVELTAKLSDDQTKMLWWCLAAIRQVR